MKNRKQTSDKVAKLAAKVLADPRASKVNKALAGSALAQTQAGTARRPRAH